MERFSQAHVVSRDQKPDLEDMMYLVLLPLSFTKLNPWRSTPADFRYVLFGYLKSINFTASHNDNILYFVLFFSFSFPS